MKKWIYIINVIIFSLITYMHADAIEKIAIVNVSNVFQQSTQRAIVAKQLEDEFKDRALELQSMENELQNKIQNLQRDASIMHPSERNTLEKSVMVQREEFTNKAKAFQQDNQSRQTEERNKILHIIQEAVKKIAKKEGYELVIDTSTVAYANDHIKDITDDVLKQVK